MKTKAEKTKDKIVEAAKKVFSEKSFHGATTKEIAEVAEVSEGSLFRYFKTKKDLLSFIIINSVVISAEKIMKEEHDNLENIITKLITSRIEISKEMFPILKLIMFETSIEKDLKKNLLQEIFLPLINQIELIFKEKQKKGEVANIDTFFISRTLICLIFGTISLNYATEGLAFLKNPFVSQEEKSPMFNDFISNMVNIYLHGVSEKEKEINIIYPDFII